ncbi:hypothetical protein KAU32_07380 [bacterium]|nr:hypothetical protein [bacterium]
MKKWILFVLLSIVFALAGYLFLCWCGVFNTYGHYRELVGPIYGFQNRVIDHQKKMGKPFTEEELKIFLEFFSISRKTENKYYKCEYEYKNGILRVLTYKKEKNPIKEPVYLELQYSKEISHEGKQAYSDGKFHKYLEERFYEIDRSK